MFMRTRWLRYADLPSFHDATNYSSEVCSALVTAYDTLRLHPNDSAAFERAAEVVRRVLPHPMAGRQRVRVNFVLGMALAAVSRYKEAISHLEEAVALARYLSEDTSDPVGVSDLLDLLYLRGAVHRGVSGYSAMADDYRAFLIFIEQFKQSPDALEAPFTLEVQLQLAGAEFFLGRYGDAKDSLEKARDLFVDITRLKTTQEVRLIEGTLDWFQALSDRWRGASDLALNHATHAASIYRELGAPISAGRVQLVAADIHLDLAMREANVEAKRNRTGNALPLIKEGMRLIDQSDDLVGKALAKLTETRCCRLIGRLEDRVGAIEGVVRRGRELGDEAILAQAYTALGDEFLGQGRVEAAFRQYYKAYSQVEKSDVRALGVFAQRALLRREEDEI